MSPRSMKPFEPMSEPTDTAAIVVVITPEGLAALDEYRRDALHLLARAIRRQGGSSAMN